MHSTDLPPFATLRRPYDVSDDTGDDLVALVVFDDVPGPRDPRLVLRYLRDLGIDVGTLGQLHDAINGLADEEELAAHWCREGVAVSHASDGQWFLFLDGRA